MCDTTAKTKPKCLIAYVAHDVVRRTGTNELPASVTQQANARVGSLGEEDARLLNSTIREVANFVGKVLTRALLVCFPDVAGATLTPRFATFRSSEEIVKANGLVPSSIIAPLLMENLLCSKEDIDAVRERLKRAEEKVEQEGRGVVAGGSVVAGGEGEAAASYSK